MRVERMRGAATFSSVLHGIALITLLAGLPAGGASGMLFAEDFFRDPIMTNVIVSPDGEYLAILGRRWGEDPVTREVIETIHDGSRAIWIRHNRSETARIAIDLKGYVRYFAWIDDDSLIVNDTTKSRESDHVIDVGFSKDQLEFQIRSIETPGGMIDALPNHDEEILWAHSDESESIVYRTSVSSLTEFDPDHGRNRWAGLSEKKVVARLAGAVRWWITDRDGIVRGAVAFEGDEAPEAVLRYRESDSAPWRELYRTENPEEVIVPVGMARDNRNLLVLSDSGRDTTALVEFEVDSAMLGRVVFALPDADVLDILYDFSGGEVLTAVYEEAGLRRYHHFEAFSDRFQRSLEHAFPGQSVAITSTSRDSRYQAVFVSSPRNPGAFYLLDTEKRVASFLGRIMPWLDPNALADVRALDVTSPDGTNVEAFLTIPTDSNGSLPPLLVLPHGGPLGVRDSREYDPLVQYVAAQNIAVLQVNFRGSAGYGRSFFEAGFRQRSKGIEDDIDAAVDMVVAKGLVDGSRMCIGGLSYGGYSALVGVIRHPKRYRCAVTIAGVSDIPLFLYSTGLAREESTRKELAKMIGDPDTEYDELIAISPAYHTESIDTPILIVHGTEDRRVDIEHAYRLRAMLKARGKPFSWYVLEGAGHELSTRQWIEVARALSRFVGDFLYPFDAESFEAGAD